ncbi:MAG: sugar transferase [Planctomycetota bacterium]|jgi:lipopolysaccharide/colanic/teichoic acid biosynthesis glycosyltransferase
MVGNRQTQEYSSYLDCWTKRCLDVAVCLLLLVPALIVIACTGLSILIREGRPVFFIQRRAGRNGRPFWMPKLRTLHNNANPHETRSRPNGPELVTGTGKFLRDHRLDELPQLFSVLRGHMSVVGPRPELPDIAQTYRPIHRKRLLVKPGVTGLWQVMGNRDVHIHQNIKYDLYYLRKASLWLDLKILAMTIPFMLRRTRETDL